MSEQKRILVVEDEGIIATEIQDRLERLGHEVPAVANSGQEALQLARRQSFDLILIDIRLRGGMDGIATVQALKREIDTPVVYLTAYADAETVRRAKMTEPFGYIVKPFSDGDLRSAVEISTYKYELERQVRASEAWLRATLRNIGDGVLAASPEGQVVFMNPAAEHLTGWNSVDAQGRPVAEVLVVYNRASNTRVANPLISVLYSAGGDMNMSRIFTLVRRDGARIAIDFRAYPNRTDEELLGVVAVFRDATTGYNYRSA